MKYLMKIFFVVIFTSLTNAMYAQPQFVDYEDFEADIKRGVDIKTLNGKYNLINILKLDSTYAAQIFKVYPHKKEIMRDWNNYLSNLNSYENIMIPTCDEDLKEFLKSDRLIEINHRDIGFNLKVSPIYIKENRIAIVEFYYENGSSEYLFRVQNGEIQCYWISSTLETPAFGYEDKDEDLPFIFAKVMPTFQGKDIHHFRDWIKNHKSLAYLSNSAKVFAANFIINKDGSLSDVKVLLDDEIDDSAIIDIVRVMEQSPKWTPGIHNEQPVEIRMTIIIEF